MGKRSSRTVAKLVSPVVPVAPVARRQQTSAGGLASPEVVLSIVTLALDGVEPALYGKQKRAFKLVSWRWHDAIRMMSPDVAVVSGMKSLRQLLSVCSQSSDRARRITNLSISLVLGRAYMDPTWLAYAIELVEVCAPGLQHFGFESDDEMVVPRAPLVRLLDPTALRSITLPRADDRVSTSDLLSLCIRFPLLEIFDTPCVSMSRSLAARRIEVRFIPYRRLSIGRISSNPTIDSAEFHELLMLQKPAHISLGLMPARPQRFRRDPTAHVLTSYLLGLLLHPHMRTLRLYAAIGADERDEEGNAQSVHLETDVEPHSSLSPPVDGRQRRLIIDRALDAPVDRDPRDIAERWSELEARCHAAGIQVSQA